NGRALSSIDAPQLHSKQYAYLDPNGHVQELSLAAGGSWHVNDLTGLAGAPLAGGSTLLGFFASQFHTKQYVYLDQSGHVQELSLASSGSWHVNDLTALTGAPLA